MYAVKCPVFFLSRYHDNNEAQLAKITGPLWIRRRRRRLVFLFHIIVSF